MVDETPDHAVTLARGPSLASSALAARLQAALGAAFRIKRELDGGGMSRVFVAEEVALGRQVAVKVLPPSVGASLDAERFRREVLLAASLRHPHIVPLLAAGEVDGIVYYTMPFVEGESLRHRLEREVALPPTEVVRIVGEVAGALTYAHRRGVIHRDVKPGNVLVDDEHALVADFGIAKALSDATADATDLASEQQGTPPHLASPRASADTSGPLTARGMVVGTPGYISPEQADGGVVDGRSDVYSLGCMTFEMLTGVSPTGTRPTPAIEAALPALTDPVRAVLACAMAPAAVDRFDTPAAFAHALARALLGQTLPGTVVAVPAIAPAARRQRAWQIGAGLALALVAGGGWWAVRRHQHAVAGAHARVAVLPFTNRGAGDDAYAVSGFTEEITRRLAGVSALTVIAAPSAASYAGTQSGATQIGRELGVDYLLEGTIVRDSSPTDGIRVRVTPWLVRTVDGARVWSAPAVAADLLTAERSVAQQVVSALDVELTPEGAHALAAPPTRDLAAYDVFLHANALSTRPNWYVAATRRRATRLYEQAVQRDTAFAAAWANLARAYSRQHLFGDDAATASLLPAARAAAERAFALDSTRPEASLALGDVETDRWRAIERYVVALRSNPRDVELLYALGTEQERLGRYDDALATFARAAAIDPRSPSAPAEMASVYDYRGEYTAAVRMREREFALTPYNVFTYVAQALSYFNARGDTAAARGVLDRAVRTVGRAPVVQALATRSGLAASRVLAPLLDPVSRRALDTLSIGAAPSGPWRVYRLRAEHFERSGDAARARAYHDSARILLEPQARAHPTDPSMAAALGLAYAGLGRPTDALREGRRALTHLATATTVEDSAQTVFAFAMIAVRAGADDLALETLARGLPHDSPSVSPYWLRLDPIWTPLHADPRFARLSAVADSTPVR